MKQLFWRPKWNFEETIQKTINWYKNVYQESMNPIECSISELNNYLNEIKN